MLARAGTHLHDVIVPHVGVPAVAAAQLQVQEQRRRGALRQRRARARARARQRHQRAQLPEELRVPAATPPRTRQPPPFKRSLCSDCPIPKAAKMRCECGTKSRELNERPT